MFKVAKRIISPIIKPLRFLKFKLQTKLNLIDFNTVYFEGGLGSQLLSYMLLRFKNEKNEMAPCDLSYFKNIKNDSHTDGQVSLWTFKLDNYGILMNELPIKNQRNRFKLKPKYIPLDFLSIDKDFLKKVKTEVKLNIKNLNSYLKTHNVEIDDPYGVIHLRKGDYLFVASHLIKEEQVINLLTKISEFLPQTIFIASDGEIDRSLLDWFKINKPDIQLKLTEKEVDSIILHDLMRNSRILVAANSTFSFSAALLSSERTISFIPQIFYKEDQKRDKDSSIHQFASDYAVLKY